jgi:hypothetical protein
MNSHIVRMLPAALGSLGGAAAIYSGNQGLYRAAPGHTPSLNEVPAQKMRFIYSRNQYPRNQCAL